MYDLVEHSFLSDSQSDLAQVCKRCVSIPECTVMLNTAMMFPNHEATLGRILHTLAACGS